MCPQIETSCCIKSDQESMFLSWIKGKEEERLLRHYDENTDLYKDFIKNIIQAQRLARQIMRH